MKIGFNVKTMAALALAGCVTLTSLPLSTVNSSVTPENEKEPVAQSIFLPGEVYSASSEATGYKVDVDGDGKLDYVSFGASNVNGYGLQGYLPEGITADNKADANVFGFDRCPEGSYPDLVRDHFEEHGILVDMHQLAISSMRAEELHILLDDNYDGDAYSAWRFTGGGREEWFITACGSVAAAREAYQTAVKNADLITVDIGVNNFGVYLSNEIMNPGWCGHDVTTIDSEYVEYYAQLRSWLLAKVPELEGYSEELDVIAYAFLGFIANFDASIEKIREYNADATIVVVPVQNIVADMKLDLGGAVLDLGYIVSEITNAANLYTAHISPYHDEYFYASDIRENGKARVDFFLDTIKEYNGDVSTLDADMLDCFNVYQDGFSVIDTVRGYLTNEYAAYLVQIGAALKQAELFPADKEFTIADFIALGDSAIGYGIFDGTDFESYIPTFEGIYNGYYGALDAAYDAYAKLMQFGSTYDTLNLEGYNGRAEDVVLEALMNTIINSALAGFNAPGYRFTIPEDFVDQIAASGNISTESVETVLAFGVRTAIGNSFFGHPNRAGHIQVADAVIYAIENEVGGVGFTVDYAKGIIEKIVAVYKYADSIGLVDDVKAQVSDIIEEYIDDVKAEATEKVSVCVENAFNVINNKRDDILEYVGKIKDISEAVKEKIEAISKR